MQHDKMVHDLLATGAQQTVLIFLCAWKIKTFEFAKKSIMITVYESSRGSYCMIQSHLSQLAEQLKLLINQIAASKLNELACNTDCSHED